MYLGRQLGEFPVVFHGGFIRRYHLETLSKNTTAHEIRLGFRSRFMEQINSPLLVFGAGQAGISSVPAFNPFGHNSWCGNYDFGVILSPLGARVFVVQMAICGTKTHLASIKKGCFIASTDHSISLALEQP